MWDQWNFLPRTARRNKHECGVLLKYSIERVDWSLTWKFACHSLRGWKGKAKSCEVGLSECGFLIQCALRRWLQQPLPSRSKDQIQNSRQEPVLARALLAKASVPSCVRTVSKPYLFWWLGLAFERKADAPSYCKQTKIEGSDRGFGVVAAACKAGALPAELHAHRGYCYQF
jgi:hypothetical protein